MAVFENRLPRLALLCCLVSCGDSGPKPEAQKPAETATKAVEKAPEPAPAQTKSLYKRGLVLAYSKFEGTAPKAARAELLIPSGDSFKVEGLEDGESNVFHKAFAITLQNGEGRLITLGGMKAAVKSWKRTDAGLVAETLWTEAFGGKFDRMRDAEVGDVDGDKIDDIVVGTHDQGVVAYLSPVGPNGAWVINKLDREKDTFIHEIELGDLDGDGVREVYATPSEPNRLDAGAQKGQVVRYEPKKNEKRTVVADLGKRHAKEILVKDVDGDGKDELYVAVEALTSGARDSVKIVEPVEIRRYDADTPKDKGVVVARINDRFCRFLTAGDVDGDGKKEVVAAAFRSGVWLLKPGADPKKEWTAQNIETDSSGFEHAALLTDLDEDGKDELYVAADEQGELRRYTFKDGKFTRDTLLKRDRPKETWTWNIMPLPPALFPRP